MQRNTVILVFVLAVVLVGGYFFITKNTANDELSITPEAITGQLVTPSVSEAVAPVPATPATTGKVKEFTMTAYYDAQGKWFSLKEMTVKKGDTVRVSITNVKGAHNFNIDELGITKGLPLNEKIVVEFVAGKAGDFVYYCAMPGHRAGGQWGTLHVAE